MQNRYVGDVGDYGKYALLRCLCTGYSEEPLRLAVVWCLFPDESLNNDGRHISYLTKPDYAVLDPDLYAALDSIVSAGRRHVSAIAEAECLPASTVFFSEPLLKNERTRPAERIRHRNIWLHKCLHHTQGCKLVFFDPDNGLETKSVPKHHPKAGKYIYWDELGQFWYRGSTLLIYHHLNRTASAAQQIQALKVRFAIVLDQAVVVPLIFRRGSSRAFWLVHRGDTLGQELERRAADLLDTGWSRHFRPLGWPSHDQTVTVTG